MNTYCVQVPLLPLDSFMFHVTRTLGINFNTKPNPPQDIPQIVDIGMETRQHTTDAFPVRLSWESPWTSFLSNIHLLQNKQRINAYSVQVINMRRRMTEVWLLTPNKSKTQYNYKKKIVDVILSKCVEIYLWQFLTKIKRKVRFLMEKQIKTLRSKRNGMTKTNSDRSPRGITGSLLSYVCFCVVPRRL
jgi:hypothetical protein